MSFLPFTILAYFLNACAVSIDKFLLKKSIPQPLLYVFYISLFSLLALILLPFTHIPTLETFILASTSTLLWTLAAYLMFRALKFGIVSRVIPIIGTLTPIFLLIHASTYSTININQTWAVGFLIFGLIFITLINWKGKLELKELVFELLASLFFAVSYLLLREAYLRDDFLTVLAWSKVILLPLLIAIPFIKKQHSNLNPLFFAGQLAGGASQLLLTFSISLATPALINSLQGLQYVFLLILNFKENKSKFALVSKMAGIALIFIGLYILTAPQTKVQTLGMSYSPQFAQKLGLNPKTTYIKMLDELNIKLVRLPVYWDEVETFPNQLNFSGLDYYLNEAQKRQVKIILVLGLKQPRWPECFAPIWVKEATSAQKQEKLLNLITQEINYFKNYPAISTWQVENEPNLSFGDCGKNGFKKDDLLAKEVKIVREADDRPILITASGELSSWSQPLNLADIFGHTLYRRIWSPYFGSIDYPLPPAFYQLKGKLSKFLNGSRAKIIISELQTEPWMPDYKNMWEVEPDLQAKLLPVSKLSSNIEYASQTGADEAILWGIEWWYFMAQNNHPEYLQFAKTLFKITLLNDRPKV